MANPLPTGYPTGRSAAVRPAVESGREHAARRTTTPTAKLD